MKNNRPAFSQQVLGLAVAACFAGAVHANPTGPAVAHGSASFAANGNTLTVTNAPGTIINWQAFSIRPDEVTRFVQSGAASAVLNRVTGAEHSAILGQLLSNGRVFLINPNGVTVGAGARIDTAGFVASSLALSNEDFLAGKFRFTDPGSTGKVANAGTINAHTGGPVYLIAPTVENHGVITAPNGDILLASGRSVELVSAASPHLRVQVQSGGEALNVGRLVAESGRVGLYGAAIRNAGTVSADSASVNAAGNVVLKASRDVTLDATSVVTANGAQGGAVHIQAEGGTLLAEGRIEATGSVARGGEVRLLGERVALVGHAAVDASGSAGGGTVLVGGDYLGGNPGVQNAARTVVATGARVAADATGQGDGGRVIVWSDEYTGFYGSISARGGADGGDGGFVETSSRDNLQALGAVDAAASTGRAGEWLLDPRNVTIANAANFNGAFGGGSPNVFTPVGDSAVADRNAIQTSLNAGTSVTITTGTTGAQAGDITVQDSITKTAITAGTPTLTLDAAGSIAVNSAISGSAANRVLNVSMNAGAGIAFGAGGSINTRNGAVTVSAGGAIGLGAVNAGTGAISVSAGGPITQNASTALTTTGLTALAAGAANDITLASSANSLGNVRVLSGNDVSIRDNTAFAFGGGASTVSGNLIVDSNGNVTQAAGASLAVVGTTTINTRGANRNVTLNQPTNDFGGAVTVTPAANTTRNVNLRDANSIALGAITATGTLTVQSGGAITDVGILTIGGNTALTAGANDITLDGATNRFGNVRIVSGANVTLRDDTAFSFGGGVSNVSGNLAVDSNGNVTQAGGAAVSVAGTTTVNTRGANRDVTLSQANDFSGPVTIAPAIGSIRDVNYRNTNAGALTPATPAAHRNLTIVHDNAAIALPTKSLTGSLTLTAGGPITDVGTITAGTTTLTAGANDIALDGATNRFGNVRIVSAGNVSIRDNTAFSFGGGASGVSGNLAIDSNGSVTQAAGSAVNAGGATTINTRGPNRDVTLTQSNDFGGAVTIAPLTGGVRNVNVVDVNALVLNAASAATFQARTLAGDLTLNGPITATGAGNSILLASAANFVNNAGPAALSAGAGRWLVYSTDPSANSFGGLASGNQAIWGTTYPTPIAQPGNRYVFTLPQTLTYTSTNASKVYGDDATAAVAGAYTVSGLQTNTYGGAIVADTLGAVASGTPNVTSIGSSATASVAGSPYVITVDTTPVTSLTGYTIAANSAGQLTVNGRPITVQANDQSRAYGDANPVTGSYTITAGSLAGADSIANANVTSPATVTSGVGPYALTPTAANFGAGSAANYTITFADGVLTVTPRPITVTANDQSKVYGQPDPTFTFVAPTVNGDVLAGALTRAAGETVAGSPYAITQGTVTNANNPNYAITFVNGQLAITPAPLTIAADSKSRLYGDANPPLTATFTGLANGDTTAAIPGVSLTTPATIGSNVGSYAINVASGLNSNYTITTVDGLLVITPAPLTIRADDASRQFGQPNPPFTVTSAGFRLGQTIGNLNGVLVVSSPATPNSPAGPYPITPFGVSSPNYAITFVDGTLRVGQVPPPSDSALVTALERSADDAPDSVRPVLPRTIDCLVLERSGERRVLNRCN